MKPEQIISEGRGTIVDVRTRAEFIGGHVPGSVNIPLQELQGSMEEAKQLQQPLVLCCASGGRSAIATQMLSQQGISCCNGGGWMEVNYHKSQTA